MKFHEELPAPKGASRPQIRTGEIVQAVIALAQRPGVWGELARAPRTTSGGHPNNTVHAMARRWRGYGLEAQVRRQGDEYVLFVRVPADAR